MQGLICEGTTEDSVRLSDDIELVGDLSPRQVRVEIHAAGVCGSDMSCIHGKYYMPTPLIPGHEAAGKVVEVGSRPQDKHIIVFAARDLQVGEELQYDYQFALGGEKIECHCGAPNCWGRMN